MPVDSTIPAPASGTGYCWVRSINRDRQSRQLTTITACQSSQSKEPARISFLQVVMVLFQVEHTRARTHTHTHEQDHDASSQNPQTTFLHQIQKLSLSYPWGEDALMALTLKGDAIMLDWLRTRIYCAWVSIAFQIICSNKSFVST